MKTITLRSALRNLSISILLGTAALLPLTLAACAKSKDAKAEDMGHDMSKMPKEDGHKDHQH